MKLQKMSVLAALVLSGLVASKSTAVAQDQKGGGRRGPSIEKQMEKMTDELKLTDEQKPKVKAVLEDTQKKRQELFTDSSVPREDRREKIRGLRDNEKKKLKEILTADQYTKYEKMLQDLRGGGRGGKKKQDGSGASKEKKD
jgi:protein CpxP